MRTDIYGQQIFTELDLCSLAMKDQDRALSSVFVEKEITIPDELELRPKFKLKKYTPSTMTISEFDTAMQNEWFMPEEYYSFDIAKWVLEQCKTEEELQRAGAELLEYNARNMLTLLQYLKYLVDTMRKHKVIWGVGRGSSVSSFVLYLIGVHRINSLFYQLDINEFLK